MRLDSTVSHEAPDITEQQHANLGTLAEWLVGSADRINFSMSDFAGAKPGIAPRIEQSLNRASLNPFDFARVAVQHVCGAVGCAVGHGPLAGIAPMKQETWVAYAARVFGTEIEDEAASGPLWCYLFAGGWGARDDTASGAGHRIFYVLDHGIPSNHFDQTWGDALLSYRLDEASTPNRPVRILGWALRPDHPSRGCWLSPARLLRASDRLTVGHSERAKT